MNKFDLGLNGYDLDSGLNGNIFKKIGKAVKTGLSSLNKYRKKADNIGRSLTRKVKPKALKKIEDKTRKVGRDLDKKGITKIAAAAVATYFTAGATSGWLASAAGKTLARSAISATLKSAGRDNQKYQIAKAEAAAESDYQKEIAAYLGQAIAATPQFQAVVDKMRAEGKTDEQILQHWVDSDYFNQQAGGAAVAATYPIVMDQMVSSGIPPQYAQPYALEYATEAAEQGVQEVKNEVSGGADLAKLLLPIGLMIILGG